MNALYPTYVRDKEGGEVKRAVRSGHRECQAQSIQSMQDHIISSQSTQSIRLVSGESI